MTADTWQIKLLYDGECPLCVREVNFLQRRDAGRGLVAFVDIANPDYQAAAHGGVDFETAMGRIHAVRPDGSLVQNVAVFREIYTILGIGWIYAATAWPLIGPAVDWIYGLWADYRLAVTGRPPLAEIMAQREVKLAARERDRCRV